MNQFNIELDWKFTLSISIARVLLTFISSTAFSHTKQYAKRKKKKSKIGTFTTIFAVGYSSKS